MFNIKQGLDRDLHLSEIPQLEDVRVRRNTKKRYTTWKSEEPPSPKQQWGLLPQGVIEANSTDAFSEKLDKHKRGRNKELC